MTRRFPAAPDEDIQEAIDIYRELHDGNEPSEVVIDDDEVWEGRTLVALGRLEFTGYTTRKGAEPDTMYVHEFGDEGEDIAIEDDDKPLLCVDLESGRLAIVGGRYRVNWRGIVG